MFWRSSVFTSSGSQVSQVERRGEANMNSFRIQYNIIAQPSDWNGYDVIKLLTTEDAQNKYPTLECSTLNDSYAAL